VARDSSTPDLALLSWQSVENLFQFLGQLENTVMVVLGFKAGPLILEAGGLPRAKYRRQNRFYGARLPETETPPKHTEKTDLSRARKPPLSPSGWCEIDPRRVPPSCCSFSSRNRFQTTLTDQPEIQNKNPAAISVDFPRTIFANWPNK
jgi:hypothetical protein